MRPSLQRILRGRLGINLHGLYVITNENIDDGHGAVAHSTIARAALAGGARIIQLRDKSTPLPRLLPIAHEIRGLTRAAGALFIINDRVDVTLAVRADGVHLGPDDMPPRAARKVLGPHFLIGVSCGNVEEALHAEREGADYIGAGAVFSTMTKSDAGAPIGLQTLRVMMEATALPVAAIGGINENNIAAVVQTGAAMACVVSAVASAGDETAMTAATRALIHAASFPENHGEQR